MANVPNFTLSPIIGGASFGTANTNRDGTGSIDNIFNGAANGTRIDSVSINALGTTTAGMIRIYIYDGASIRLADEIPVLAITPSGTVPSWKAFLGTSGAESIFPLHLPSGHSIRMSTEKGESFHVHVYGGNF